MATLFVVEDDPSTQLLIVSALEKEGHRVVTCADGARALAQMADVNPDLLITDINLPGLDGYALVRQLRDMPQWAALPIILLSSMAQRANIRVGMTTGADDYITKPFSLAELRESVRNQLKRRLSLEGLQDAAVKQAVESLRDQISAQYEKKLHETVDRYWGEKDSDWSKNGVEATVLYTGMKHYLRYSEELTTEQLGNVVQRYYEAMVDAVQLFGASSVHFSGEGLLAVFTIENDTMSVNKEMRVWRACLAVMNASNRLKMSFDPKLTQIGLPLFETTTAIHAGSIQMIGVDGFAGRASSAVPIGDTVNAVREMHKKMAPVWKITASSELSERLKGVAKINRRSVINVPPRLHALDACELVAMDVDLLVGA